MKNFYAQSARSARATSHYVVLVVSIFIVQNRSASLRAQCPAPPTEIIETQLDDDGLGAACEEPTDVQFACMAAKLQELGLPVRSRPIAL